MKTALAAISPNGTGSRENSPIHNARTRRTALKKNHIFTLGIEEEFQIIDPDTRKLRSHVQQILAGGKMVLKEHVKAEMHQSVVELGTEVCGDARIARQQVVQLRSQLATIAEAEGLKIASAGTHPFSHWMDQLITDHERYATIVKDMQQIARVNLIFGLHVHVGIPDREEAIDIINQARYFLPHIYALSVNSPFWLGQNTGLKAYRQMIFERHAGFMHALQHRLDRAVEVDAAAGIEPHRRLETLLHSVERRERDAEIGGEPNQGDRVDAAFLEVAAKAGRRLMVVLEEGRIAVDGRPEALADHQLGLGPGEPGMEIGA